MLLYFPPSPAPVIYFGAAGEAMRSVKIGLCDLTPYVEAYTAMNSARIGSFDITPKVEGVAMSGCKVANLGIGNS